MEHPYSNFEGTELWIILKRALTDLLENKDIQITTNEKYIIGYLCQVISEDKLLAKHLAESIKYE